jgi:hypothetical protein
VRHTWLPMLMLIGACADDSSPVTTPDVNSQDVSVPDVGPADTAVDLPDPDKTCDVVQDIGLVEDGLELTVDLDDPGPNDLGRCVSPAVASGARALRFRVAASARLTLTADGIPNLVGEVVVPPQPVIEIRRLDCAPTSAGECSRVRTTVFSLDADVDYFMLINAQKDSGGVQLKFELENLVCTPTQNSCEGGTVSSCSEDGSTLTESKCVDACDPANGCLGDTCDSATDIIVAASGTTTITGNRAAYSNSWSGENRAGCNLLAGEEPGPTVGPDFVIRIPNVAKNATVTLSAENPMSEGAYGFFIVDSCSAVGCLAAGSFDANSDNQLIYRASQDADILVRVEALGEMDRFFAIDVSVTQ